VAQLKGSVDFAIITIREDEFRATLQRFPTQDIIDGQRRYSLSSVMTQSGHKLTVVVARASDQGEAQNTVRDLIEDLDPARLVLVGIAGATPTGRLTLGDVVVATRLQDFTIDARIEDKALEYGISDGPMDRISQDLIAMLPSDDLRGAFGAWNSDDRIGMTRPIVSLSEENFYGGDQWVAKVRESLTHHFPDGKLNRAPVVTTGPTTASLINTETLIEWRKVASHLVDIERELPWIFREAKRRSREFPILAIRGISDVVGFNTHDAWTAYACHSAASLTHELLSSGMVPLGVNRVIRTQANPNVTAAPSRAAEKLRLASSITAADAKLVVSEDLLGGSIYLDADLYVPRDVETQVVKHLNLAADRRKPIVVIGEAGRGKTSLLWHLYTHFNRFADWDAWFIKSTMLVRSLKDENSRSRLSSEVLVSAVQASIAANRRPLLFIDTVDLLLHDEASRDFLVGLILKLDGLGCQTVLSTRPREVVRLNAFEFRRVTLLNYEGPELEDAIRKHLERFYSESVREDHDRQVSEILKAVARGLPLREVCENPLTLRMLFTIYRPAKIPPDINVFELYQLYWSHRVESDLRAGSPFSAPGTVNADDCAELVALTMLAEGSPEISTQNVNQLLEEFSVPREHVELLNTRGVLHSSGTGLTSFFHQTFFEHGAARALLRKMPSESLSLLQKRLQARRDDLFITPIYEQALLLAEHSGYTVRQHAESAIAELFENDSLPAVMSALYVYCHRHNVAESTRFAAQTALRKSEEAIQIRFLELAPNIPSTRLAVLFEELNLIWETGSDRTKDHLIELLIRLVPRDWERVQAFFESRTLTTWAFAQKESSNIARKVLDVITAMSFHDPTWAWSQMVEFCGASLPRSNGRELSIGLVNFLADNASFFEPKTIASRFERDTSSLTLDKARDFHELGRSIGRLWAIEWTANQRSIGSVLSEVDSTEQVVRAVTRTRGLPHILIKASKSEALTALKHIEEESNHYNRSLWIDYVLPEWLDLSESADSQAAPSPYLYTYLIKIFTDEAFDWSIKTLFVQALRYTTLSTRSLSTLIPPHIFCEPKLWVDTDRLAVIFGDAYFIGHPGPEAAIQLLKQNPSAYVNAVSKVILPSLMKRISSSQRMMDTFFQIAMMFDDVAQIMRALEAIPDRSPMFLKWTTRVRDHCLGVLNTSKNPQQRRYAILTWEELLKRGTEPVHKLSELKSFMKSEADARVRGPLLSIIGRSTAVMSDGVKEAFEVLEPLARGVDTALRRRAMLAIANVVAGSPGDISEYAFTALDNALSPPLDAQRLYSLRPIIERLAESNAEVAAELTLKLIKGAHYGGLGSSGRHKIFGRLKTTLRLVVRSASHHQRLEFARLVPEVGRILGSLVTDALCHEALSELSPELDELLKANVAGDIKQIILRYRYTQERSLGGGTWPEIYNLVLQTSRSLQQTMKSQDSITIHGDNYGHIQQGGQQNVQGVDSEPRASLGRSADKEGKLSVQTVGLAGDRMSETLNVLLLAANSVDTVDSRAVDQIQAIVKAIRAAPFQDKFRIEMEPALRVSGLGISLLHHPAQILHISGHSRKTEGLILENDLGQVAKVQCAPLMEVLFSAGSHLQLVFLGFCHSADCAEKLSARIDFALGIKGEISVKSALEFAPAFYRALASGISIQKAFEYGKSILGLEERSDADAIVLHVREGADATNSVIRSHANNPQQTEYRDDRHADLDVGLAKSSGILQSDLSAEGDRRGTETLRPVPVEIKPPPPPRVFIGREDALHDLRQLLIVNQRDKNRENITVVSGLPGVGKTSLVSAIGNDADIGRTFKDGVLWIALEQKPNIVSEIAKWGRALGSEEILKAVTVKDATALLTRLLSRRRMLLIVDDVWDTGHAAAFTDAAGEQCAVMVTTRLPKVAQALTTDKISHYPLPVLTEEFALQLLRILAPEVVSQNEKDCLELVRDLERLPLALHVAAGLLRRESNLDWGVKDLIEEIRKGTELIKSQAPKDRIEKDGVIPSVSSLLHRSTDVLDEFTRDCFICLGVFAPKPATFDLGALKAVWQVDDPRPAVRALVDHGLLEPVGGGSFQMHRILVDHARSFLPSGKIS
jgi:nucleoside phosphorylase/DNA replication protein DnaC